MSDSLVEQIDAITGFDPEVSHCQLDDLLLAQMPPEVQEAARRLRERCDWWAFA